jgi:hypothetical protein
MRAGKDSIWWMALLRGMKQSKEVVVMCSWCKHKNQRAGGRKIKERRRR